MDLTGGSLLFGQLCRIGMAGEPPNRVDRVSEGFSPELAGRIATLLDRALPAGAFPR